ncbi:protein-arginine deiminase type-4 [Cebus imitator]|uniref:protein-arginine deiminase type-4 n=1 Tax=Cebus imitator TaxID=2715852 RepID=UPI00189ABCDB|nr:protein-arginine deiminase type-4 [Cebus imitator]
MAQRTLIRVSPEQPTHAVCVLGIVTQLDVCSSAPEDCTSFSIDASPGVVVDTAHSPPTKKIPTGSPSALLQVQISYYGPRTPPVKALLYLTGVEISLCADITRTGKVKPTRAVKDQRTWTWGPSGQGAILLVNCDRDNLKSSAMDCEDEEVLDSKDLQDMSLMTLSTKTPRDFITHTLVLHVARSEMDKVRVFQATRDKLPSKYTVVLGPQRPSYSLMLPGGKCNTNFYVEGLAFPDTDFPGLITLTISMLHSSNLDFPETLVFQDSVVFRMAPWIMTPNTQPPQEVYACSIFENEDFLKSVIDLAKKAKCKLTICPEEENMDDQWMQDEMEIGYIQAPHKTLPVVFDSPRNRGLKEFPIKRVMGPDFGYVTRGPQAGGVSGLDSFGNLEVSPPVTVRGKEYPLGRILFGSCCYPSPHSQEMHQALQDFLRAQQVQAPVKLYSDWLSVGHVDEFLSFVPAPDRKGFRLLLASPRSCYRLFQEQQNEGHGEALMFQGVKKKNQQKIKNILSNKTLREHNSFVESCIDWNRELLKRELGLAESDIIDIPQLFKVKEFKAEAFFPNMVNMLVLGKYLGIPKPFGPIINGRCCLEEKVRSLLEPLGLHCTFINDFYTYHIRHGEVHCGTNVRRKPFSFKWWNMVP